MSYIFDTLYGIGLKNKIKECNISVIDKNNHSLVVYSYGYLDNSSKVECTKIIHSDTMPYNIKDTMPSNIKDTNHYQVAIHYAEEKWKNKLEKGYNTDIEYVKKYIKDDNSVPLIIDRNVHCSIISKASLLESNVSLLNL